MPREPAGLWNKKISYLIFPMTFSLKKHTEIIRNDQKKKINNNKNVYNHKLEMCLSLLLESPIHTFKPIVFEDV